ASLTSVSEDAYEYYRVIDLCSGFPSGREWRSVAALSRYVGTAPGQCTLASNHTGAEPPAAAARSAIDGVGGEGARPVSKGAAKKPGRGFGGSAAVDVGGLPERRPCRHLLRRQSGCSAVADGAGDGYRRLFVWPFLCLCPRRRPRLFAPRLLFGKPHRGPAAQ